MRNNNQQILAELRAIKWCVAAGASGFVLIGVGVLLFAWTVYAMTDAFEQEIAKAQSTEFRDQARTLFEAAKLEELIERANERAQEYPNDPDAYWYRGRAYAAQKEWNKALADINQTAFLAPNWKAEYTDPLIAEIRRRMKSR